MKNTQFFGCFVLIALSLVSCSNTAVVGTAVSVPGSSTVSTTTTNPVPVVPVDLAPVSGPEFYANMPIGGVSLVGECKNLGIQQWMQKYGLVGGFHVVATKVEMTITGEQNVLKLDCYGGYANTTTGEKISTASIFPINSNSKFITKGFILQALAKHSEYNVQSKVGLILPAFDALADTAKATKLEDLLNHTSGIDNANIALSPIASPDLSAYLKRLTNLNMPIGTQKPFYYSNANYIIAAAVSEVLTGKTYQQQLSDMLVSVGAKKAYVDSFDTYSNKVLQSGTRDFTVPAISAGAGGISAQPLALLKLVNNKIFPYEGSIGINGMGSQSWIHKTDKLTIIMTSNSYNADDLLQWGADIGGPLTGLIQASPAGDLWPQVAGQY